MASSNGQGFGVGGGDADGGAPKDVRMSGIHRLRRHKVIAYWGRLFLQLGRQFIEDRCLKLGQALAFQSILSLVPLLTVAFVGLNAFGQNTEKELIVDKITAIFPGMPQGFSETLVGFTQKISGGALGSFGLLITAYLGFSLFKLVEEVFNEIWRTGQKRSLLQKFMVFYALATLMPVLAGASLGMSAKIPSELRGLHFMGPFVVSWLGLLGMYKFLPVARVRWSAAVLGGGLAALVFELAKIGFGTYVKVALVKQQGIYGAVGLLPLLFLWIYLAWLVVLFGCEIAYAAQNLAALELAMQLERSQGRQERTVLAARVLLTCATVHRDGGGAAKRRDLALLYQLPEEAIDRIMKNLIARKLALEIPGDSTGFVPARPPDRIGLADIMPTLALTDGAPLRSPKFDALVTELDAWRTGRLGALSLADMLEAPGTVARAIERAAAEEKARMLAEIGVADAAAAEPVADVAVAAVGAVEAPPDEPAA